MGTPSGLYRYDGYFFTTYKYSAEGNMRLLNNNHITGLFDVGDNRLLVTEQGNKFSVFDVVGGVFLDMAESEMQTLYAQCRERHVDSMAIVPYASVIANGGDVITDNLGNTVVIDDKGSLWHIDRTTGATVKMNVYDAELFPVVSSKKYKVLTSPATGLIWVSTNGCGITVYDRATGIERRIRQSSGLISTDYIVDMCMDTDGNVWVADEFHGVVYLASSPPDGELYLLDSQQEGLRSNQVAIMHWLPDSTLLVANTQGDVYSSDRHLHISSSPTWRGLDIHAISVDKEGRVWIGSRQRGLMAGDGQWYHHNAGDPSSLSSDNIFSLLCDDAGRMWVAAEGSHLDLAVRQSDGTYRFRHFFDSDFAPRVMLQDAGRTIWVGTRTGLYSFRPEALLRSPSAFRQHLSSSDLNYSEVNSLCEDSRGVIWVGTTGSGLYSNVGVDGTFVRTTDIPLISSDVQSILDDAGRRLWIATTNGLTCYDRTSGRTVHHYSESNLLRNYYANNCALLLSDGRVAFGTNSGILVYNGTDSGETIEGVRLQVTDVLVDGVSCPLSPSGDAVRLAYNENSPTFRFSAFNYRELATTRYSYQLEGYDAGWSEPDSYSFVTYRNLPPGDYVLRVRSEVRGAVSELMLRVIVAHPWWQSPWAFIAYFVLGVGVALAVWRQLRTVYKLRMSLSIERQLTEFKLQFFTNISHEFRTPLTIIRGAMERIHEAESSAAVSGTSPLGIFASLRQPLSNMQKSTDRMLRLINQLLEFRKMQNNKLRLALEETDVVAFVKDIYLSFTDIAENKRISYNFLPNVKNHTMYIDRQHVDKIVFNLLSNAFKYTPSGGDITVRLRLESPQPSSPLSPPSVPNRVESWLTISVEDTGVGVPKEKQPELFQRFMQSSFSNNSIGIGLHLTKALVDVHHGSITFNKNTPHGSIFTITLPAEKTVYAPEDFLQAAVPAASLSEFQQSVGAPAGMESMVATSHEKQFRTVTYRELMSEPMNDRRVLVAEDDTDVADFLRQTLGRYFIVDIATDGGEALRKALADTPDLIVSDVMMPNIDGFQLTERLRKQPQTQAVPILLLTALSADDKRLKGIEQGADAYLTKPFDTNLLIATCRQLIEQRDKLRQSYAQTTNTQHVAPPEIIVDERDKQLLDRMQRWLYDHVNNPNLNIDDVAQAMGYGRTIFYRKVRALTGQTPADYIRTIRMNRAAEMLREETVTVAEVCYRVGISDPHYFTKVFKQQFGISPKKYQKGEK
jgi:signal transduction histidine kinase/AraC-like DNA-binding protein/ligand-binding sensor domain-containing protein